MNNIDKKKIIATLETSIGQEKTFRIDLISK
jgi:hypothetical protein